MEKKKACRACRFFMGDTLERCSHENATSQNSIGDTVWQRAVDMRERSEKCGWQATLFEPTIPATWRQTAVRLAPVAALCALVVTCGLFRHP
jgi:hypothetical protein